MSEIDKKIDPLEKILNDLQNASEVNCFSDSLLRSRHRVLSFSNDEELKKFYTPYLRLSDVVKIIIEQQEKISNLEVKIKNLEQNCESLKSELKSANEIVKKQEEENRNMRSELTLFYGFCNAVLVAITALQKSYEYLETHKFKFSIYDLISKINQIIEPDKRHSFEIEGSGIFESVRFTAAKTAEPNLSISKLMSLYKEWSQKNVINNPQISASVKAIFQELQDNLEKILNSNIDQLAKSQKFGLKLKVVNYASKSS